MKAFRTSLTVRFAIVVMTLLGYMVFANHCALARTAVRVKTDKQEKAGCCHGKRDGEPKPADQRDDCTQCCKSLVAVMPDSAKVADPQAQVAALLPVVWALWCDLADFETTATPEVDTGPPPRAVSFSELVLHRSLRSHAPPFLS